jgi:transcriptional regulator with XRE-family HTH domain
MRSPNEKKEFAERLAQAMRNSRKRIETPTELADAFNLRYHGTSITAQAAYKWLAGTSIPTLDKVETLAEMFKVPVQWLRLGIPGPSKSQPKTITKDINKPVAPTGEELQLIARLRLMSAYRRKLILDLASDLSLEHEAWREHST